MRLPVILCPAESNQFNADWSGSTAAGTTATGNCRAGYAGQPQRVCLIDGTWESTVTNPCIRTGAPASTVLGRRAHEARGLTHHVRGESRGLRMFRMDARSCATEVFCPNVQEQNANWAKTATQASGVLVTGTCVTTYGGSPQRTCQTDGTWSAVTSPCTRTLGAAGAPRRSDPRTTKGRPVPRARLFGGL